MVYDDLMIRNNTVLDYNTNWSRPVTVQPASVDQDDLPQPASVDQDDLPQPYSDLGSDYSSAFPMASSPVSIILQLILELYMI